ncbi:flagellar biosynthetic protein FliR [Sphingomonas morindae]|uniref:Flagellar biosynthetic protein FliR n=1 Tax=Sphingomonas morindae TaxID=1541170 RepID=A0ABY4X574_9SPHN|nr:flagellar biosynthetic protein FliR [Sphingomonas morindae]USI72005.1 flagellar biosynthetic protein FliR [Sphingomonas morindae]
MARLPAELLVLLLLFARIGTVTMLLPAFSEEAIPGRIRLLLGLGVTLGLYGLVRPRLVPLAEAGGLIAPLSCELLVGLALGLVVRLVFQASAMAGAVISMQIGLTSALVSDPALGGQAPLLARFASLAAAMLCLALDQHHHWIAALLRSYAAFPPGAMPPAADFARLAVTGCGEATALALSMAAPMLLYAMVFNIMLGFAARMAPAIQIFFIAQPLAIMLGLGLLGTVIGAMLTTFANGMAAILAGLGIA